MPDAKRRRTLLAVTTALGAIGAGFTAVPFVLSLQPSARARALGAPVEVDIAKLEDGQRITVEWRGKPVWILKRTLAMLKRLKEIGHRLADPDSAVASQQPPYAGTLYRSIRPELLVLIGICTHLGCVPLARLQTGGASGLGADWPGGFFCPCHGSMFDLAGRVFKNVPAPTNLVVPPHHFASATRLIVGVDPPQSPGAEQTLEL